MREIIGNLKHKRGISSFSGTEISKLLEGGYLSQRRETTFTQKETFSPSTLGYGRGCCPRYWYLAFEGAEWEDKTDAPGFANMSYGSAAHERIQSMLKDAGVLIDEELEINLSDPPIRGFLDVIVEIDGEQLVGEIKTTRQEAYEYRKISMNPAAYHLLQTLIYLKATGKKKGFILYENKNDQNFLTIPVEMNEKNEKFLEDALNWCREVRTAWEEKKKPKQVYRRDNKICAECPVQKTCWEDTDFQVIIPKLEVKVP